MDDMPIVHQQLSDRQRQIIESAMKLIAEEGIVHFTTKKLAHEVNVSEPALYRHFENKEAIVLGVVKYINEKTHDIFNSFDNVKDKFAIEILEIKCLSLMQFFYKNIFCAKTSMNSGVFFPNKELINEIKSLENKISANVKSIIERGQKEGDIDTGLDSGQVTRIIMGSISLTIQNWSTSDVKYDLVADWMKVWGTIKKMISVPK